MREDLQQRAREAAARCRERNQYNGDNLYAVAFRRLEEKVTYARIVNSWDEHTPHRGRWAEGVNCRE